MSDGVRYTYATEKGRWCWRKVVETSIPNLTQNRCLQCQKSTLESGQDAVIKGDCSLKRQCGLGVQNTRSSFSFSFFFFFSHLWEEPLAALRWDCTRVHGLLRKMRCLPNIFRHMEKDSGDHCPKKQVIYFSRFYILSCTSTCR